MEWVATVRSAHGAALTAWVEQRVTAQATPAGADRARLRELEQLTRRAYGSTPARTAATTTPTYSRRTASSSQELQRGFKQGRTRLARPRALATLVGGGSQRGCSTNQRLNCGPAGTTSANLVATPASGAPPEALPDSAGHQRPGTMEDMAATRIYVKTAVAVDQSHHTRPQQGVAQPVATQHRST
jgi:hypothetical protein